MEQERVRANVRGDRCPYCHEDIVPSDPAKQACSSCMAWHHVACMEEHGACAACGDEEVSTRTLGREEAGYRQAYRRLFGAFEALMTTLGVGAGAGLGWLAGDPEIAGLLMLLGAVSGLVLSYHLSPRPAVHQDSQKNPEAQPDVNHPPHVVQRVGHALYYPWLSGGALLGMALAALVSLSAPSLALGALTGAAVGAAGIAAQSRRKGGQSQTSQKELPSKEQD